MIVTHNLKFDTRIVRRWKNLEKIRPNPISIDHQILMNFMVDSPRSVWRIKLNSLSGTCFVKNMSQSKKTHPNWWTPTDAIASHVLKKLNQSKIPTGGGLFSRRKIAMALNAVQRKTFFILRLKLEVCSAAYYSNPLFIRNMNMMMNSFFFKKVKQTFEKTLFFNFIDLMNIYNRNRRRENHNHCREMYESR